jgi:hypothetical protein
MGDRPTGTMGHPLCAGNSHVVAGSDNLKTRPDNGLVENQKSGAKTLTRGGKVDAVEGAASKRVVINQWKSVDEAKKFYSSPLLRRRSHRKKFTAGGADFYRRGSTKPN